ncbi:hypothetical protein LINPERPRIM_LOCUS19922 [Linum perenne]
MDSPSFWTKIRQLIINMLLKFSSFKIGRLEIGI